MGLFRGLVVIGLSLGCWKSKESSSSMRPQQLAGEARAGASARKVTNVFEKLVPRHGEVPECDGAISLKVVEAAGRALQADWKTDAFRPFLMRRAELSSPPRVHVEVRETWEEFLADDSGEPQGDGIFIEYAPEYVYMVVRVGADNESYCPVRQERNASGDIRLVWGLRLRVVV